MILSAMIMLQLVIVLSMSMTGAFVAASAQQQQQLKSDGGLTATLNGNQFATGDTIAVNGTVGQRENDSFVGIEIINPENVTVESGFPDITANNSFNYSFFAGVNSEFDSTPMNLSGNYRILLYYSVPGESYEREEVEFIFAYTHTDNTTAIPTGTSSSQATTTSNSTTTRTSASSSGVELLSQPVYQERSIEEAQTPINQTHLQVTFSGNGTVNLPNSTETIRTTSIGTGVSSLIDGTFAGKVVLTSEDGSENATATTYEIGAYNIQDDTGKGVAIAVFDTNSTGKLAALDGVILAGQDEFLPDGSAFITYWKWKS
jgi:hypothetical protein